jgi:hypothetical protein
MPGPLIGLAIRGAGVALRGAGKALKKRKKRKKRKSTNDPALTTALALTGGAGAAIKGKLIMDDRKKNRTGGR